MSYRIAVLISGGGTTFLNLHEKISAGSLQASIVGVVSSSSKAAGLSLARERGYPTFVVRRRKYADDHQFSQAIDHHLKACRPDLIVLGGFLKKYLPPAQWAERCINIHPALIPAFCGPGFYGMKVHQAVWARSSRVSGCTVHLVTPEYDAGPIIVQKTAALAPADSPEDIRRKVFEKECEALPEAIRLFIDRRVTFSNGRCLIN